MEQINNNLKKANEEIKEIKNNLKGNMLLIQARQLICDEINFEVKNIWEHIILVGEQNIAVKDIDSFIISTKEEDRKNSKTIEKMIKHVGFLGPDPGLKMI